MGKRIFCGMIIVFLVLFFVNPVVFAEEKEPPFLEESTIDINVDDNKYYEIYQDITIVNMDEIEKNEILHTVSNINKTQVDNLKIISDDKELTYTVEEKDALNKYMLDVSGNDSDTLNYQISYTVQLDDEEFSVPLFVPEFGSIAEKNIVTIEFEAPEDKVLQLNSFPVLKGKTGSSDTSYMMNIPSHVKYVFYEEKRHFNAFNIIGWGSLIGFLIIIFIWIRGETKKQKGEV